MTRFAGLAAFAALTTLNCIACASAQELRACEFAVKARCISGDASVTLADGAVLRAEIEVYWCGLHGRPGYSCIIDSSRSDQDSRWSEDGGATLITNASPWNPQQPDRVKVIVAQDVDIDLSDAQSAGRCGAGAELPLAIVIPAQGGACRVQLRTP
jgi:hypothetical protein